MAGFETTRFCRESCTAVRAREDRGTEYVLRCGDGEGRTVCYEVFPGMELCRHRYQAHACRETREEGGLLVDCGPPLFCAQKSRGQTAPAGCIAFS